MCASAESDGTFVLNVHMYICDLCFLRPQGFTQFVLRVPDRRRFGVNVGCAGNLTCVGGNRVFDEMVSRNVFRYFAKQDGSFRLFRCFAKWPVSTKHVSRNSETT
jgi:hypothetical protein